MVVNYITAVMDNYSLVTNKPFNFELVNWYFIGINLALV